MSAQEELVHNNSLRGDTTLGNRKRKQTLGHLAPKATLPPGTSGTTWSDELAVNTKEDKDVENETLVGAFRVVNLQDNNKNTTENMIKI